MGIQWDRQSLFSFHVVATVNSDSAAHPMQCAASESVSRDLAPSALFACAPAADSPAERKPRTLAFTLTCMTLTSHLLLPSVKLSAATLRDSSSVHKNPAEVNAKTPFPFLFQFCQFC